ncbi:putative ATP-dependent RNA helicase ddx60 [Desmophyllum pertusum]|uniref:ATP-dependent RNA helicase ddx60 n=1 Tax=Desmophyllum pertusum TaxID=174260 RepID=A0A9W9ZTM5_9CNID|nr:putative ATP-dependent RNA helicase ddx60 [Desmophyllum pertusum]
MDSTGNNFLSGKTFQSLVDHLKAQDKLPALVFSFDRMQCETLAAGLAQELVERENVLKGGERNLKLVKDQEKKRRQAEKQMKRKRDVTEKDKSKSSQRKNLEDQDEEKDLSVSNEPLPECTLAFTHGIGKEDLKKIIGPHSASSRKKEKKTHHCIQLALKRGISYHHAGLDNKRRSGVEMLFRKKYLQVVAATGTWPLVYICHARQLCLLETRPS